MTRGDMLHMAPGKRQPGVYLIHFNEPLSHARHYLGHAADIPARISAHRAGNGAKIMQAVTARGIDWQLARTWPTDTISAAWGIETALKNWRNGPRICPICTPGTRRAANPKPAPARTWHQPRNTRR
jgi:predicted GIY-YIG superfamily endonuclease